MKLLLLILWWYMGHIKRVILSSLICLSLVGPSWATVLWQMDWEGTTIYDAPNGYSDATQGSESGGAGALTTTDPFAGSKSLQITWTRHAYSLRNASYSWTASGLGDSSYYLRTAAGGNPQINNPGFITMGGSYGSRGTLGSLSVGQFAYDDANSLGYDTVYVRIAGSGDPDSQAEDYIDAGRDGQLFTYDSGSYTACEWDLHTPSVMTGYHEYYVGFAIKFDSSQEYFVPVGRKMIYRQGGTEPGGAQSLLFFGTKYYNDFCGAGPTAGAFYFKSTSDIDASANYPGAERFTIGGPKCAGVTDNDCDTWPGCVEGSNALLTADGQWHTIILYVYEHATAGVLTMWLDGNKVIDARPSAWTGLSCEGNAMVNDHADFPQLKFPTYFNLGPLVGDQTEYWDNFIIATTYEEVAEYLGEGESSTPTTMQGVFVGSFQ